MFLDSCQVHLHRLHANFGSFFHNHFKLEKMIPGLTYFLPIVIQLLDSNLFDPDDQLKAAQQLTDLLDVKKVSNGQYETCSADSTLNCPSNSECYEVPQEDCNSEDVCRTRLINMCLERVTTSTRMQRDVSKLYLTIRYSLYRLIDMNHII